MKDIAEAQAKLDALNSEIAGPAIHQMLERTEQVKQLKHLLTLKDAAIKVLMEENEELLQEVADCDEQIKEGIARKVKAIRKFADEHRAEIEVLMAENDKLVSRISELVHYRPSRKL